MFAAPVPTKLSEVPRWAGSYLSVVGQVLDELEARNPPLRAHHAHVFWMLAVRDAQAVGVTLCQALLAAAAVHVVEPNTAWNGEQQADIYCRIA